MATDIQNRIIDLVKMKPGISLQSLTLAYNALESEKDNLLSTDGMKRLLDVMEDELMLHWDSNNDKIILL